jgi:hypothetical protein
MSDTITLKCETVLSWLRELSMFSNCDPSPMVDAVCEEIAAALKVQLVQAPANSELTAMEARKDAAYLERNQLVALLSKLFPSGKKHTATEGWSEDWHGCVYIDLPTGQASWHYHDSQQHLFDHLSPYAGDWDGHSTEQKYERVAKVAQPVQAPVATAYKNLMMSGTLGAVFHREVLTGTKLYAAPVQPVQGRDAQDAKRWRWSLGYYLDNGFFPKYPVIGLLDDMHQVEEKIDAYIAGKTAWSGKFGGYATCPQPELLYAAPVQPVKQAFADLVRQHEMERCIEIAERNCNGENIAKAIRERTTT